MLPLPIAFPASRPARPRSPLIFFALALVALLAASAPVAADPPRTVALVGGMLVDGNGGPPLQRSVVLIEGERIRAVGTVATLPVPKGAEVISTWGMSVLPGLWDMHVHLMIDGHADYGHWDKAYFDRFESEIMPASARQLLHAGVTSARDLGAPLEPILHVRDAIRRGALEGPTLYVSGPFLQHAPYPGTEAYRWGISGPADARAKVRKIAEAGVDVVKLIDQDLMTLEEVQAVVDEAHARKLPVVAHAHRPEEIRRGLKSGVDCFEHTGLATAPEYPADIVTMLRERTAQMSLGPLFWTPTVEGLMNYEYLRDNPLVLDDPAWQEGLKADTVKDIKDSIAHPDQLAYYQITPARQRTLSRKIQQLRESGVVLLVGTDSGIPLNFHSQSTWNELDVWVNKLGIAPMDAIRAATYWPSVAMNVDKEVGTVSPGKMADVIAVRGDVLRHIDLLSSPALVIRHGKRHR